MPITSKKLNAFTKKVADLPDKPSQSGMSAAEVKAQMDAAPEELRVAHNGLIDSLRLTTDGDSGADNIGATQLNAQSGATVQAILEYLLAQLQGVSQGAVADGSMNALKLQLGVGLIADINNALTIKTGKHVKLDANGLTVPAIDTLDYDLYALWLEQYYLGEVQGGISPSGARGIGLQGFLNTTSIDIPNTNAAIDTTNREAKITRNIGISTDNQSTNSTGSASTLGTTYGTKFKPLQNMKIRKIGMKASVTTNLTIAIYDVQTSALVAKTTSVSALTGTGRDFAVGDFTASPPILQANKEYFLCVLNPGTSVQAYGFNATARTITLSNGKQYTFTDPTHYWSVSGDACPTTQSAVSNGDWQMYIEIDDGYPASNTVKEIAKTLPNNITRTVAYVSANLPASTSITPQASFDGGTTWIIGTLISNRADPKFAGFTEYQYEFTNSPGGTNLDFRVLLNSADPLTTPTVKRYGLFFYET